VIIFPQTPYALSLTLTYYRYSLAPPIIEERKSVKNEVEIRGLKRAHLRDGACYVQFLAWMDEKMYKGFEITEWEAAWRLTEFRRKAKNYMGLAYETISASGPNAAFPHYHPLKSDRYIISKDTPYVNDSGGQYRDGTCDTTRTMHYGRPTRPQREAYTRVLQGHVGGFKKKNPCERVLISCTRRSRLTPLSSQRARQVPNWMSLDGRIYGRTV
jgi:Xaa-Pro aminopeptidase